MLYLVRIVTVIGVDSKKMKVWRWVVSLMLVGLLPVSTMGRFVVEKNSLRVTSPEKIRGTHDSAIGNFGIPQYGGSMAGNVIYPKDNKKGCKEFDEFGISFKSTPGALPTIVLLDRGSNISTFSIFLFSQFGTPNLIPILFSSLSCGGRLLLCFEGLECPEGWCFCCSCCRRC